MSTQEKEVYEPHIVDNTAIYKMVSERKSQSRETTSLLR